MYSRSRRTDSSGAARPPRVTIGFRRPPVPSVGLSRFQSRQSQQIASAGHEVSPSLGSFPAPVAAPLQPSHRLHPAEGFLDQLADPLAGGHSQVTIE